MHSPLVEISVHVKSHYSLCQQFKVSWVKGDFQVSVNDLLIPSCIPLSTETED